MADVKVVFGLLVFIAFLGFMFSAVASSGITDKDYEECIPSISNLGGLLLIANTDAGCGASPWIGLIFMIPLVIALAVYITPFIGD